MAGGNKRYNRIWVDIAESILICTNGYCAEESVSEKNRKATQIPTRNKLYRHPFSMYCSVLGITAMVTSFIRSRIGRSKWNRPNGKINVMPPLYFVLCHRAISRFTEPTINLPWMVIKLQNYKNIITRAIQHYNSNAKQCCWNASPH